MGRKECLPNGVFEANTQARLLPAFEIAKEKTAIITVDQSLKVFKRNQPSMLTRARVQFRRLTTDSGVDDAQKDEGQDLAHRLSIVLSNSLGLELPALPIKPFVFDHIVAERHFC